MGTAQTVTQRVPGRPLTRCHRPPDADHGGNVDAMPAVQSKTPPQSTAIDAVDQIVHDSRGDSPTFAIRRSFLRTTAGKDDTGREHWTPGPFANLVRAGDHRGLLLYFLVLTKASSGTWNSRLPSAAWARALDHPLPNTKSASSAISKTWLRLERQNLVSRTRVKKLADVAILREDGTGVDYTHPGQAKDAHFKLPLSLWTAGPADGQRWYQTLTLPELAVMVIARSLYDGFPLPYENVPEWYGISADTFSRGAKGLAHHGVLRIDTDYRKAPLSASGWTTENHFTLLPPLGPVGARAGRRPAKAETDV